MSTPFRALATAALVALVAAVSIPVISTAETSGTRDITVREKLGALKIIDAKPRARDPFSRFSLGDRVLTRQAMFDESNRRIGTLVSDCVGVGRTAPLFKTTLQCTASYRLKDGQVVAAGAVRLGDRQSVKGRREGAVPIVGGSGAYRGASGEVTPGAPVKGYESVDVLHLDG